MTEQISEERLRNTLAWATARLGQLSGAEVIVGAITELLERRVEVEKYKAWAASCDEPGGDCWRPPITAPADCDCLFSLRPIAKDDPYFVDTSGNPILGKGEPRVILSRYGRWSSLEVMTGWMPLPSPVNRP